MKTIKWTISILIIISCFIATFMAIQSITAHTDVMTVLYGEHALTSQFFESTKPEVSCNIDARTFTYAKQTYCDDEEKSSYWENSIEHPLVEMKFNLHGVGWIRRNFYGSIDGESHGNHNFTTPKKGGIWFHTVIPINSSTYKIPVHRDVVISFEDNLKKENKIFEWKAKGEVELKPVYWHRKYGISISKNLGFHLTGEWKTGDAQTYTPLPIEKPHYGYVKGSWQVKIKEKKLDVKRNGDPCIDVSFNKKNFTHYDNDLKVTVKKDDLYMATMHIYGELVKTAYPDSENKLTLSKTLTDYGYYKVTIRVYYGGDESGANTTLYSFHQYIYRDRN